jgi:transcriptional regulator with XRE-family HTH domain
MDDIYERFEELLKMRGVTTYQVSQATGIATSTFSNWKKGKYTPKRPKLKLIADFFGISVDYFIMGREVEDDFKEGNDHLIAQIRCDVELSRVLPKYFELSENKKKHIIELIDYLSEDL